MPAMNLTGEWETLEAAFGLSLPRGDSDETSTMRPMARRQPGAAFARPVQLEGLAQIVGLAIGAPEFQRR